jgi:hypothetical protein
LSIAAFLNKDALFGSQGGVDSVDALYAKMNKIDGLFIPKGFPPPAEVDLTDKEVIYLGVP